MILYVNGNNEIKDVNTTSDENLTPIIFENDYIAENWSVAKLCCYKVFLNNAGEVESLKPYIDTRIVEQLDRQGQQNITLQAQVDYLAMMTDVEMM